MGRILATQRYAQWLFDETDMTTTYEYQKRYLQVLQSTAPGMWSLKMPSHSVHIDALLRVFPDARLIWATVTRTKRRARWPTCGNCPRA